MHFNALFISTLLAAASACALPAKKQPYWTVKNIQRDCNDDGCKFTLNVDSHDNSQMHSCQGKVNEKQMEDSTKMNLYCGGYFGDLTVAPESTNFHVYEHADGHINHIMFSVENAEFKSDKPIPPSDHDIFTTSTI